MQYNITYRQKDGGWQYIISYKQNGKWKQKSKQGFKGKHSEGKTECQNAAIKMVEELKKDISLDTPAEYKDITFKELAQDFIKHETIYKESNTIKSYTAAFKVYEGLNNKLIIDISLNDIQNCTDELCKKEMKTSTVLKYISEIKLLFDYAVKKKIILINPIKLISDVEVAKIKPKEKRALNKNEVIDLLSKIKSEKYYLISLLAVFCGFRIGEIIGLTVNDIDTKNNTININKQWKKITNIKYGMGDLKTVNSYRIVPVPSFVIQKIKNYIDEKNIGQVERLFPYKNTNSMSSNLREYYRKCGYKVSVHELRHTYITNLHASNQLDVKTIAVLSGHSVEQDLRQYVHYNDDMRRNAANKIKNIFDEFLTEGK